MAIWHQILGGARFVKPSEIPEYHWSVEIAFASPKTLVFPLNSREQERGDCSKKDLKRSPEDNIEWSQIVQEHGRIKIRSEARPNAPGGWPGATDPSRNGNDVHTTAVVLRGSDPQTWLDDDVRPGEMKLRGHMTERRLRIRSSFFRTNQFVPTLSR
jgi:hypothetical protein